MYSKLLFFLLFCYVILLYDRKWVGRSHGYCIGIDKCYCDEGWTGESCSKREFWEKCTRDYVVKYSYKSENCTGRYYLINSYYNAFSNNVKIFENSTKVCSENRYIKRKFRFLNDTKRMEWIECDGCFRPNENCVMRFGIVDLKECFKTIQRCNRVTYYSKYAIKTYTYKCEINF